MKSSRRTCSPRPHSRRPGHSTKTSLGAENKTNTTTNEASEGAQEFVASEMLIGRHQEAHSSANMSRRPRANKTRPNRRRGRPIKLLACSLIIMLNVGNVSQMLVRAQCPWKRHSAELHSDCICDFNLGQVVPQPPVAPGAEPAGAQVAPEPRLTQVSATPMAMPINRMSVQCAPVDFEQLLRALKQTASVQLPAHLARLALQASAAHLQPASNQTSRQLDQGAPPSEQPDTIQVEQMQIISQAKLDLLHVSNSSIIRLANNTFLIDDLRRLGANDTRTQGQSSDSAASDATIASTGPLVVAIQLLHLSRCSISSIEPLAFNGLQWTLTSLSLADNQLEFVPSQAIASLINLRALDLSNNKILHLANGHLFSKLIRLQTLRLADNRQLGSQYPIHFNAFAGLEHQLIDLNLKNTQLAEFPLAISRLRGLSFLNLAQNRITQIPARALSQSKALTAINLERNRLVNIEEESFGGVEQSLSSLSLLGNLIDQFPGKPLRRLEALRRLDLGFNRIGRLPVDSFQQNKKLILVALDGNPLETLPELAFKPLEGTLKGLGVGGKALNCDCRLSWMLRWQLDHQLQVSSREKSPQFCSQPHYLRSLVSFAALKPEHLTCQSEATPAASTGAPPTSPVDSSSAVALFDATRPQIALGALSSGFDSTWNQIATVASDRRFSPPSQQPLLINGATGAGWLVSDASRTLVAHGDGQVVATPASGANHSASSVHSRPDLPTYLTIGQFDAPTSRMVDPAAPTTTTTTATTQCPMTTILSPTAQAELQADATVATTTTAYNFIGQDPATTTTTLATMDTTGTNNQLVPSDQEQLSATTSAPPDEEISSGASSVSAFALATEPPVDELTTDSSGHKKLNRHGYQATTNGHDDEQSFSRTTRLTKAANRNQSAAVEPLRRQVTMSWTKNDTPNAPIATSRLASDASGTTTTTTTPKPLIQSVFGDRAAPPQPITIQTTKQLDPGTSITSKPQKPRSSGANVVRQQLATTRQVSGGQQLTSPPMVPAVPTTINVYKPAFSQHHMNGRQQQQTQMGQASLSRPEPPKGPRFVDDPAQLAPGATLSTTEQHQYLSSLSPTANEEDVDHQAAASVIGSHFELARESSSHPVSGPMVPLAGPTNQPTTRRIISAITTVRPEIPITTTSIDQQQLVTTIQPQLDETSENIVAANGLQATSKFPATTLLDLSRIIGLLSENIKQEQLLELQPGSDERKQVRSQQNNTRLSVLSLYQQQGITNSTSRTKLLQTTSNGSHKNSTPVDQQLGLATTKLVTKEQPQVGSSEIQTPASGGPKNIPEAPTITTTRVTTTVRMVDGGAAATPRVSQIGQPVQQSYRTKTTKDATATTLALTTVPVYQTSTDKSRLNTTSSAYLFTLDKVQTDKQDSQGYLSDIEAGHGLARNSGNRYPATPSMPTIRLSSDAISKYARTDGNDFASKHRVGGTQRAIVNLQQPEQQTAIQTTTSQAANQQDSSRQANGHVISTTGDQPPISGDSMAIATAATQIDSNVQQQTNKQPMATYKGHIGIVTKNSSLFLAPSTQSTSQRSNGPERTSIRPSTGSLQPKGADDPSASAGGTTTTSSPARTSQQTNLTLVARLPKLADFDQVALIFAGSLCLAIFFLASLAAICTCFSLIRHNKTQRPIHRPSSANSSSCGAMTASSGQQQAVEIGSATGGLVGGTTNANSSNISPSSSSFGSSSTNQLHRQHSATNGARQPNGNRLAKLFCCLIPGGRGKQVIMVEAKQTSCMKQHHINSLPSKRLQQMQSQPLEHDDDNHSSSGGSSGGQMRQLIKDKMDNKSSLLLVAESGLGGKPLYPTISSSSMQHKQSNATCRRANSVLGPGRASRSNCVRLQHEYLDQQAGNWIATVEDTDQSDGCNLGHGVQGSTTSRGEYFLGIAARTLGRRAGRWTTTAANNDRATGWLSDDVQSLDSDKSYSPGANKNNRYNIADAHRAYLAGQRIRASMFVCSTSGADDTNNENASDLIGRGSRRNHAGGLLRTRGLNNVATLTAVPGAPQASLGQRHRFQELDQKHRITSDEQSDANNNTTRGYLVTGYGSPQPVSSDQMDNATMGDCNDGQQFLLTPPEVHDIPSRRTAAGVTFGRNVPASQQKRTSTSSEQQLAGFEQLIPISAEEEWPEPYLEPLDDEDEENCYDSHHRQHNHHQQQQQRHQHHHLDANSHRVHHFEQQQQEYCKDRQFEQYIERPATSSANIGVQKQPSASVASGQLAFSENLSEHYRHCTAIDKSRSTGDNLHNNQHHEAAYLANWSTISRNNTRKSVTGDNHGRQQHHHRRQASSGGATNWLRWTPETTSGGSSASNNNH